LARHPAIILAPMEEPPGFSCKRRRKNCRSGPYRDCDQEVNVACARPSYGVIVIT
jgi:hypothetical protein